MTVYVPNNPLRMTPQVFAGSSSAITVGTVVGGFGTKLPGGRTANFAVLNFNNPTWGQFGSGNFIYTTSATAGTRLIFSVLADSFFNVLAMGINTTAQTASATWNYGVGGAYSQFQAVGASFLAHPLPYPIYLPPSSSFYVYDAAGVDNTADTCIIQGFSLLF